MGKTLKGLIDSQTFPIVNDLTTGGEESALSAEQGKELNEELYGVTYHKTGARNTEYPFTLAAGDYELLSPTNNTIYFRPTYQSSTGQKGFSLTANVPLKITLTVEMNGLYFSSAGSVVITDLINNGDVNQIKDQIAPYPSQLESSQTIDTFNQGGYYTTGGKVNSSSNFIYSDFYPIELFDKVTGMVGNSIVAGVAYFSLPYLSNATFLGYYIPTGTSSAPQTISKTTLISNAPTGAKYFTISTQKYNNIEVKLYLHSFRIDTIRSDVDELAPHVFIPNSMNAQDIMKISEYWDETQGKFISVGTGWKRTPYLDLELYKRIEATIPINTSFYQIVFFDASKQHTRSEKYPGGSLTVSTIKVGIEKNNSTDRYVVISAPIGTSQDYTFNLLAYVDKIVSQQEDYGNIDITFTEPRSGAQARLITSNTLSSSSQGDEFLMIYCCGNGEDVTRIGSMPADAKAYFRSHHISIATLAYQAPLYGSEESNTGWGNDVCYNAICDLYAYLMAKYPFRKDVIIAGGSMGALTMGQIAYKKPFPIRFCLGVGPAPGLNIVWQHAGNVIKPAMRKAYGLADDGSEDSQFPTVSQGYDWRTMGWVGAGESSQKLGFPNVYLYYGNDDVIAGLFGGVTNYNTLRDALLNAGVYSVVKSIGDTGHASVNIFLEAIEDGVFERELKAGEYTTT